MATITLHGKPCKTGGELPATGSVAPDFTLVNAALEDVRLADLQGRRKIISIVPSLETPVCALSACKLNEKAGGREDVAVLIVSADLPFAQKRFCAAENTDRVTALSTMRSTFPDDYGVRIDDGPLAGLSARAVLVLDENNRVLHSQLVPEIGDEPDYDKALAALD